jgi:TonB family protein
MASVRQKTRGRRLGFWLLLAALIHAELLLFIGVVFYFYAPRNAELAGLKTGEEESISISSVDEETAMKILAELERAEEKAREEEVKKEVESTESPGQVVELPKPVEERRPDKARFAAEHDSSVEKETRKHGRFNEKARQGDDKGEETASRPPTPPTPPSRPRPPTPPTPPEATPGALAMRTPGDPRNQPAPEAPSTRPEAMTPGEDGPEKPQDQEGALAPGGRVQLQPRLATPPPGGGPSAATPPAPGTPPLVPSHQQMARAIGGGTQDHLKDVDEGESTALNAKKWKFATFFNRVKQQVREHWRPADVYRRRDPTGAIYGNKDRYTLLRVQLKPDGSLANVVLETPSGIEFLDDEAIEAFRQAQPFPNPPPQLVDPTGTISFRFGFYFELSGAPKFKIFRYGSGSM